MRADDLNLPDDLDVALALEREFWGTGNRLHEEKRRKQVNFLRGYARYGLVTQGCRAAGVSRNSFTYWSKHDDWFIDRAAAAREIAADCIEAEAMRRAVEGVDEPVIFKGEVTFIEDPNTGEKRPFTVKKYSDTLMQTVLRGVRPEKYRENISVKADVKHAGVLVTPGTALSPLDWAAQASQLQAQYAGNAGETPDGDAEE